MSEVYSWTEGSLYLYTGSATASAVVTYAENSHLTLMRGWDNRANLSGNYRDHLTGQRADLTIQTMLSNDWRAVLMYESATAVHLHIKQIKPSYMTASAGVWLYSGRVDSLQFNGSRNQAYTFSLSYHCNAWSAYGGLT